MEAIFIQIWFKEEEHLTKKTVIGKPPSLRGHNSMIVICSLLEPRTALFLYSGKYTKGILSISDNFLSGKYKKLLIAEPSLLLQFYTQTEENLSCFIFFNKQKIS